MRVLRDRRRIQRVGSTIRVDSYMDKQLNKKGEEKERGRVGLRGKGGPIRGDEQGPKRAESVWVRVRGAQCLGDSTLPGAWSSPVWIRHDSI